MPDVQLRLLASGILYRACLRAMAAAHAPSPEEKMALHARVEEAAWALPEGALRELEERDVDDGPPDTQMWRELVQRLVKP